MRSIADRLREDDRRALLAMTCEERVALALSLGARDIESFRLSQNPPVSHDEASRALRRQRQVGRLPSRSMTSAAG